MRARILRIGIVAAASVVCFGVGLAGPAPEGTESDESVVELRWALGAIEDPGAKPSAVKKDSQLETGTRLKFLLEPLSASTVYLIHLDDEDHLSVLYRESASSSASTSRSYVPPGKHWFALEDGPGRETFFLLASAEPLQELDRLLARYAEAGDPDAREKLGGDIIAEIRRVNKAHRQFSRPVEKPVMIGGQTRGSGESGIDQLAVEISAERFYGKTITIEH